MTTTTKKDKQEEQLREKLWEANGKVGNVRRRLVALCWSHAETRKGFSAGDDEWTSQDQLIANLLDDLNGAIDESVEKLSKELQGQKKALAALRAHNTKKG